MLRTALPACRERSAACLRAHQLAGILTCASDAPWRQTEQSLLSSATMRSTIGARAHLPRFITHPNGIMGSGPLQKLPSWAQWGLLVAASVALAVLLTAVRLPAVWLLGPMVAGIIMATNGGRMRVPRLPILAAQSIVGCLIARAITPDILVAVAKDWPLLLSVVLAIIAGSAFLGWAISRFKVLPGTTAVWGMAPGAASAMMYLPMQPPMPSDTGSGLDLLLLHLTALERLTEPRRPASERLADELGPDFARMLVDAITGERGIRARRVAA